MRHSWNDKHIDKSVKSLLKSLYATLGIFLFLFVAFHISSAFYTSYIANTQLNKFRIGISEDTHYLMNQGDAVSKNNILINDLVNKNREDLVKTLKQEMQSRSIGLMGLANKDGIVIGRTLSPGKYGDNVFLTAPAGRRVANGQSVQSIEMTGFDNQMFMTTARPIMQSSEMVGALFANYLLDDKYATRFSAKHLSNGTQVVFYTKAYGVYGNSFSNTDTRKLISSYFNTGSDWIKDGITDKTIDFDDGASYFIENVIFPGLDQSPGGALIFIPRIDLSPIANGVTSFLTLCIFLFLALRLHVRTKKEERGWRYYVLLFVLSIPVFILAFFALYLQNSGGIKLEHIPYTLYNSTIRLQPESGIYNLASEQSFVVTVDTGDEAVNAVQASLVFDPKAIKVKSVDTASSTCSYVIQNVIDETAGTLKISCVIINPQTGQQSIPIATINVTPLKTGTFTLAFNQTDTSVTAADGLGTNVLRLSQDGSYSVEDFNNSLTDDISSTTATTTDNRRNFVVYSPTHPNESRWYNSDTADFVWRGKSNSIYRYNFDTNPETIPTDEHVTAGNKLSIPVPGDGIYYFHLQLNAGGPIAHYRIRSDRTPPTILSLNASRDTIVVGDVVRFSFNATDPVSGIQHNYYIDLGNHLFLPIGQELFVPFLTTGDQQLKLRVYDSAGNYSEKIQTVHVENKN